MKLKHYSTSVVGYAYDRVRFTADQKAELQKRMIETNLADIERRVALLWGSPLHDSEDSTIRRGAPGIVRPTDV